MKNAFIRALTVAIITAITPAALSAQAYGNAAAQADQNLTVTSMLQYAIEDEYFARAEYVLVMTQFGSAKPFTSIKNAEDTHINSLTALFSSRKLPLPPDEGARHTVLPQTLRLALETGVQAEIDNIAMYERFLKEPVISSAENADVKSVFVNLKKASENHLKAFKRQL